MKNWIKITTVVFALFVSATLFAQDPLFQDVKVDEFEKLVNAGKGIILDVRTPKEYAEGHVNGSININYFDKDFNDQVGKLDSAMPVYVYCHSGGRSSKAMTIMKGQGFTTAYNLIGGYAAWKNLHK
jgi:rhodanese-related sulfurtransferase